MTFAKSKSKSSLITWSISNSLFLFADSGTNSSSKVSAITFWAKGLGLESGLLMVIAVEILIDEMLHFESITSTSSGFFTCVHLGVSKRNIDYYLLFPTGPYIESLNQSG